MIIVHAVQKLLNISRLKPALFITEPSASQELHSWYARLISTTFRGKFMVMYTHEPSLVIVIARGKTVAGTLPEFYDRLERLLTRNHFEPGFIEKEMKLVKEGFVISKTNNKSVLASMNVIGQNVEYLCSRAGQYDSIDMDQVEDAFMDWLTRDSTRPSQYRCTSDYWKEKGLIKE
jgi:hypothetical protein